MKALFLLVIFLCYVSCTSVIYTTNGETIYSTGKNKNGETLLDREASSLTIIKSCKTCHGKAGNRIHPSIRFGALRNNASPAYTDTLFFRFLDHDLKSDGTKANIGVIWKMSRQDKMDLWNYLNGF